MEKPRQERCSDTFDFYAMACVRNPVGSDSSMGDAVDGPADQSRLPVKVADSHAVTLMDQQTSCGAWLDIDASCRPAS
jgi:hypothetical protein